MKGRLEFISVGVIAVESRYGTGSGSDWIQAFNAGYELYLQNCGIVA